MIDKNDIAEAHEEHKDISVIVLQTKLKPVQKEVIDNW